MNNLINMDNNSTTINTVDLVEIINKFREFESKKLGTDRKHSKPLTHDNLMKKIKKEIEILKNNGINSLVNFNESTYTNSRGKTYPCFSLNRDGMLQMLNSESALVRYKTIEYINKLEQQNNPMQQYLNMSEEDRAIAYFQQRKEIKMLELENKQKDQVIGELKPKADYTDVILKSVDALTITQIAKDYGLSGQTMNKTLHDLGVQYKQSGQWLLYSKYQSCGYTKSDTYKYENNNGEVRTKINTKWTQKGRLFLYNLLKENDILPLIEKVQEAA
ncbi:phage antirepressor KilAC domain-containing protein [Clostridium perfringens]|nr:phage antirepressor KilAC domain-containing protein [Clostridium perfringens]